MSLNYHGRVGVEGGPVGIVVPETRHVGAGWTVRVGKRCVFGPTRKFQRIDYRNRDQETTEGEVVSGTQGVPDSTQVGGGQGTRQRNVE